MTINPDIFTHTYEFDFGDSFIKGDVEFDTDNKMSFNIKQSAEPMPAETYQLCLDLLNIILKIYTSGNTLKLIKIKKKE